jgi:phytoene synthase
MERTSLMGRPTSFYYSFLVLPAAQRRAIIAVWDFCRAVDDAVDESPASRESNGLPDGRAAVAFWRRELAAAYDGILPSTPQARNLQPFIRGFDLPRQRFDDVIDGVEMDLVKKQYDTFDDLFLYCRRVASAVGLICVRIFGCRNPRANEYALNLGVALQLTNILRDVASDLERGRVYLPLEDLSAYGCSVAELQRGTQGAITEPIRRVIAFECRRAREFYERAADQRPDEDRRRLVAAEIMRAVYFETLCRIERSGFDVFTKSARVPKPKQAMIALSRWVWPA